MNGGGSAGTTGGGTRPFWKKKRILIPGGVLAGLVALGAIAEDPEGTGESASVSEASVVAVSDEEPDATVPEMPTTIPGTTLSVATTAPTSTSTATTSSTTLSTTSTSTSSTTSTTTVPVAVEAASVGLATLVVVDPDPAREPYERDRYDGDGWLDVDGDCLSTRHELLLTYTLEEPALDADGCRVEAGLWIDPFDGAQYTSESQVSIDHLVPLAEAHRSGAWRWDDETKQRFANDQTPGHLLVVGRDTNQAKADNAPDQWLPEDDAAHCQYALDWITTKERYELSVTAAERGALDTALASCERSRSEVRDAVEVAAPIVVITTPTTTTTTTIAPSAGPGVVVLLSCEKRSEVVTIANTGGESISLSGFLLHDDGSKHSTSLGQFGDLAPGQQLRILTGPDAVSGEGQVVWKRQNVWNNDGDIANLVGFGVTQTSRC